MRVAIQGERGANSEVAVIRLFGEVEIIPCAQLAEAFEAVATGRADCGLVPVENSQAGSINQTYDLLLDHQLVIAGEFDHRVVHCLLALPGQSIGAIKRVYSHPQALAQCDVYLRRLGAEAVPFYDTAGSAKMIQEQRLSGCAAIASRRAAELYQLEVLTEGIETNPNNYTKFLVIDTEPAPRSAQSKTSIVFVVENRPAALYQALGALATRRINLVKIESRPERTRPWDYSFYVDIDGHVEDPQVGEALDDLRRQTTFLRVLGSYPRSPAPARP
ncbi:MAG TPA: prephenate dehydratase [bacterium]|nr:prephenate dehydratase [bacterium]